MSEDDYPPPAGWTRYKRALIAPQILGTEPERLGSPLASTAHVVAWQLERDACGCTIVLGMRLDRMEPTAGLQPCPLHRAAGARAIRTAQTMPPSDEAVADLLARLLEAELVT